MHAWDFGLVAYDGECFCADHLPEEAGDFNDEDNDDIFPVFVSNANGTETCSECGVNTFGDYLDEEDEEKVVAYDISEDKDNLALLCPDCGSPEDGSLLFEGEEWGGPVPLCNACGREIEGLVSVDQRSVRR